jgi:hypothetical protein
MIKRAVADVENIIAVATVNANDRSGKLAGNDEPGAVAVVERFKGGENCSGRYLL